MVYSDVATDEQVSFKILDADDEAIYEANEQLGFTPNAAIGSVESPFVWVSEALAVGDPEIVDLPTEFGLSQNFPNPFNPSTTISFALPADSDVEIIVYNSIGQRVRSLVSGHWDAGYHSVVWDSRNDNDQRVQSGVYFYRMTTDAGFNDTRKLLLLK